MNTLLFPDIPRIYTAIAEWLACMVYISQLPLRLRGWRLVGISGGMLAVQCLFLELTGDAPLFLWIPCMIVAICLMLGLFCACCNLPVLDACYHCIRAFLLAEFAAALEWQLYFYTLFRLGWRSKVWELLCLAVIYGAVFGFILLLERHRKEAARHFKVTPRETASAVAIGLAAFLMSNLSYAYSNTPFSSGFVTDIFNTRTLVDLGGLAILYAYHLQRGELHMRYELESIQNVLQNQYAQYRQSRESIDVINRKYHDLKHQIAALRAESDPERRAAWLDEMEEDIKTYEAQNKTGNAVLDTVLTSKSLYCQKHGITLTCVADGTRLGFMSVMDICTIFGNALDNAIECELRIPDKSKRLIHVTVAVQKSFLLLRFENYYEGTLKFEGGLPVTTKKEKAYHGFGIKSIRYTAEKYGGSVTVAAKDNWFEMKVLLPLPKEETPGTKTE